MTAIVEVAVGAAGRSVGVATALVAIAFVAAFVAGFKIDGFVATTAGWRVNVAVGDRGVDVLEAVEVSVAALVASRVSVATRMVAGATMIGMVGIVVAGVVEVEGGVQATSIVIKTR